MASQQVQQLAEDVKKLSPAGQAVIGMVVDAAGKGHPTDGVDDQVQVQEAIDNGDPTIATMPDLEGLIKNHITGIEKLVLEIKVKRDMFNDSFESNPTYREHKDRVKEASKAKSSVKLQILKQPSVAKLDQELKDLKFDLNEKKKTLSDLLLDYKQQTGATQLELFDGRTMEIVQTAKVIKAK